MFRLVVSAMLVAGIASVAFAAPQNATQTEQHVSKSSKTAPRSPQASERQCIRDTGSLLKPKPGECLPVAGRSYSRQDIQTTGETRLGPALNKLDPAVTVRGYGGP